MNRLDELQARLLYLHNELKLEADSTTARLILETAIERVESSIAMIQAAMSKKRMRRKPASAFCLW